MGTGALADQLTRGRGGLSYRPSVAHFCASTKGLPFSPVAFECKRDESTLPGADSVHGKFQNVWQIGSFPTCGDSPARHGRRRG